MEPPGLREQMEATALLVQAEPRERMALTVQAVRTDLTAHPEVVERQVSQEVQVLRASQAHMGPAGHQAVAGRQAWMEPPEPPE